MSLDHHKHLNLNNYGHDTISFFFFFQSLFPFQKVLNNQVFFTSTYKHILSKFALYIFIIFHFLQCIDQ